MKTLALLLMVTLAACLPEITAIDDIDQELQELVDEAVIATLNCVDQDGIALDTVGVGSTFTCEGRNLLGTILSFEEQQILKWAVSPLSVASVDLAGEVRTLAPGTLIVTGRGTRSSVAKDTVVVK